MEILRAWIEREGRQGRRRLFAALKERFPTITPMSLTNYIQGDRIPDKDRAEVIAEVLGVQLEALTYRYVHVPENGDMLEYRAI